MKEFIGINMAHYNSR